MTTPDPDRPPFPIRTGFVEAGGHRFEVDQCGDEHSRKLALCLHGFPEHAHSWRHQLPLLARLGYRVWAPNQRGYGRSFRPAAVRDYAIDELVADVGDLIDAAGCDEVTLIGHDWGGGVAWAAAITEVRPIDRLVVMNLPHPAKFAEGVRTFAQLKRSWYMLFFQLPWLPEKLLLAGRGRLVADAFRKGAADPTRFPPDVLEVYRENALQPGAMTAMINWYRAVRVRGEVARQLQNPPKLETPTLLIWGEEDPALGKELTYGTDEYVTDLTLRYLPGVSHWVQQEAPEVVGAMLEAWLSGRPVPEASEVPAPSNAQPGP